MQPPRVRFEEAPAVRFSEALHAELKARDPGLPAAFSRKLQRAARPCVDLRSERVSPHPLRRGALMRALGAKKSEPSLGVCESKFGGIPYAEDEDFGPYSFLGQLDLTHATRALPSAARLRGLLRIDIANSADFIQLARGVWFPEAHPERAVRCPAESTGNWETRLTFEPRWCLPEGKQLDSIWPLDVPTDEFGECILPPYAAQDDPHQLLGHRSSALDDSYGFDPPAGLSDDINDYEQLLRLTFDNPAGFHWGSNVLYLLVPRRDLDAGDLRRVVCTAANY